MEELISYAKFLKDKQSFKQAGTNNGNIFNIYDTPSHKFFKILFYFENGDSEDAADNASGLLAPTWNNFIDLGESNKFYEYNSAWAYLKLNDENERAEKLEQFVTLLSSINVNSPWYFTSISGLDEALDRKVYDKEFKIEEERKKITIKCLPDPFDNRIGTLLDLYRDIVWSWSMKREVVPANLRKFDMGIYIFESNILPYDIDTNFDENIGGYTSSYKLLEFHNCEFDMNSSKSGYGEINNTEGFQQEYSIDIYYDDCFERRYNEMMMRTIGDVIITDTQNNIRSIAQGELDSKLNNSVDDLILKESQLDYKTNFYKSEGFKSGLKLEALGAVDRLGKGIYNKLTLGNLYNISPLRLKDQIDQASEGHLFTSLYNVNDYVHKTKHIVNKYDKHKSQKLGNIFKNNTLANNL